MACLCSFNRNIGSTQVTNLTNHDDIRVLAEKCFQRRFKRQALFIVHVHLVNTGQVNLCRVFCSRNVHIVRIQNIQAGIKRYGLTRTGRPRYQHHAVRTVNRFHNHLFLEIFKAQLVDIQAGSIGIQNTHHDFFAKQTGHGIHTEVDGFGIFGKLQLDTSVLRNAFFGNIQFGHHLDTRCQLAAQCQRRLHNFAQLAVGTETHTRHEFIKLKVNIGCTGSDGIMQDFLDETCYRTILFLFAIHNHSLRRLFFLHIHAHFFQQGRVALAEPFQNSA